MLLKATARIGSKQHAGSRKKKQSFVGPSRRGGKTTKGGVPQKVY